MNITLKTRAEEFKGGDVVVHNSYLWLVQKHKTGLYLNLVSLNDGGTKSALPEDCRLEGRLHITND